MFQSIATRSIVPVGLTITGFVAIGCLCLYSNIKQDMINDAAMNGRNIANTVVLSTRYAMLHNDRPNLSNIISNIGQQKGVEYLRIFNHKGYITFSRTPAEIGQQVNTTVEGCNGCHNGEKPAEKLAAIKQTRLFTNERGVKVMAMTQPIYNEPACTNSCHYHEAGKKVLGMLDIGLDQGPLQNSLALMRYRMLIFTLMTLLLTIGGVAALLNRSFFLPIKRLLALTSSEKPCEHIHALESGYGELSLLARNYHRIVNRMQEAKEALEKCRKCSKSSDHDLSE